MYPAHTHAKPVRPMMMTKLHAFCRWLTITRWHEWCLPARRKKTNTHTKPAANTPNNLSPSYIFMLNENHNACPREHFPFFFVSTLRSRFLWPNRKTKREKREMQTNIDQLRGHKTAMHIDWDLVWLKKLTKHGNGPLEAKSNSQMIIKTTEFIHTGQHTRCKRRGPNTV